MTLSIKKLPPSDYHQWDTFVAKQRTGSFFHTSRWLDRRADGKLHVLACYENETIIAGFAYLLNRRLGLKRIVKPRLTSRYSPIIADKFLQNPRKINQILNEIINHLPAYDTLSIIFPASFPEKPELTIKKIQYQCLKTNRIYPPQTETDLRQRYSRSTRKKLNIPPNKNLELTPLNEPLEVYRLANLSMESSQRAHPLSQNEFLDIYARFEIGKDAIALGVKTADGICIAAMMIIYDQQIAYPLFFGIDRKYHKTESGLFLMHNSIVWAMEHNLIFDFNGSNIPTIDAFFQKFKPQPIPLHYFQHIRTQRVKWLHALTSRFGRPLF